MGLQLLPRVEEARTDRADVAIHDPANLLVGEALDIM
jgi:hypothetical protein